MFSSGMLQGVDWYLFTDVSGQHINPIFKGQGIQEECLSLKMGSIVCLETSVNNYKSRLCNTSEERRSPFYNFISNRFLPICSHYGGIKSAHCRKIIYIQRGKFSKYTNNQQMHFNINPYPTAFPYGNGMVLHFYQQQESSTTKTVHKVINKGLKTYL